MLKTLQMKYEAISKLSNSEKRLLSVLDKDSWLTFREMGKLLNISTSTINYRISKLIRLGVLKRMSINVNLDKIGYHTVFIGINGTIGKNSLYFTENISKLNEVLCIYRGIGRYSFLVKLFYKNLDELSYRIDEWKEELGSTNIDVFLVTDIYKNSAFPDFSPELDPRVHRQAYTKKSKKETDMVDKDVKVDEKDLKILTILDKDSWTRFKEIGEYVNLTANSVFFRIKKMILNQIIRNFTIVIDPKRAGFIDAYLFIDTVHSPISPSVIASKLATDANVVFVATGIGEYSVLARILIEGSLKKLSRKVEELLKKKYASIGIKYFMTSDCYKNLSLPDFFPEFPPRPPINYGNRNNT